MKEFDIILEVWAVEGTDGQEAVKKILTQLFDLGYDATIVPDGITEVEKVEEEESDELF